MALRDLQRQTQSAEAGVIALLLGCERRFGPGCSTAWRNRSGAILFTCDSLSIMERNFARLQVEGQNESMVRMGSLLAPYGNDAALQVARDLDVKVEKPPG